MQFGMHLKTLGCSESKLDPIEYQYGVPNKLAGEYIPSHMQCVVYVEITVKSYLCILIISLLQTPVKAPYWLTEDDGGKKKKNHITSSNSKYVTHYLSLQTVTAKLSYDSYTITMLFKLFIEGNN